MKSVLTPEDHRWMNHYFKWLNLPNWDLDDPKVRYKLWRNHWLFTALGWAFKNSIDPDGYTANNRLWVRVAKGWLYDVVVFL